MTRISQPSKQQIREYMAQRATARTPPPKPEEVRTQLGWWLIEANRNVRQNR